jgi:hypothetical protein
VHEHRNVQRRSSDKRARRLVKQGLDFTKQEEGEVEVYILTKIVQILKEIQNEGNAVPTTNEVQNDTPRENTYEINQVGCSSVVTSDANTFFIVDGIENSSKAKDTALAASKTCEEFEKKIVDATTSDISKYLTVMVADGEYALPLLRDYLSHQNTRNHVMPLVGFGHATGRVMGSILRQNQHVFQELISTYVDDTSERKNKTGRIEHQKLLQYSKGVFMKITSKVLRSYIKLCCDAQTGTACTFVLSADEEKKIRRYEKQFTHVRYSKRSWHVNENQEMKLIDVTPRELATAKAILERAQGYKGAFATPLYHVLFEDCIGAELMYLLTRMRGVRFDLYSVCLKLNCKTAFRRRHNKYHNLFLGMVEQVFRVSLSNCVLRSIFVSDSHLRSYKTVTTCTCDPGYRCEERVETNSHIGSMCGFNRRRSRFVYVTR